MAITQTKDDEAFEKAIAAGCTPRWYDGIIGWAWHCDCPGSGDEHCIDQQCSMVKWYRRSNA
jgi:hypothetical protein